MRQNFSPNLRKVIKKLLSQFRKKSFALNELDLKLKPYINYTKGYFIEVGANDGIKQSNTLYFEKYMGWHGLLIEPIPDLAIQCSRNRPNCIVENYALVSFEYEPSDINMTYCDLMSVVRGGMKTEEEEIEHIRKGSEKRDFTPYILRVPAKPLSHILDKHNIEKIDLLSLDVEGFELEALKGIDFSRHRPTYLLIEARYKSDIDNFLEPFYEPVAQLSHHDVLYHWK